MSTTPNDSLATLASSLGVDITVVRNNDYTGQRLIIAGFLMAKAAAPQAAPPNAVLTVDTASTTAWTTTISASLQQLVEATTALTSAPHTHTTTGPAARLPTLADVPKFDGRPDSDVHAWIEATQRLKIIFNGIHDKKVAATVLIAALTDTAASWWRSLPTSFRETLAVDDEALLAAVRNHFGPGQARVALGRLQTNRLHPGDDVVGFTAAFRRDIALAQPGAAYALALLSQAVADVPALAMAIHRATPAGSATNDKQLEVALTTLTNETSAMARAGLWSPTGAASINATTPHRPPPRRAQHPTTSGPPPGPCRFCERAGIPAQLHWHSDCPRRNPPAPVTKTTPAVKPAQQGDFA